MTALPVDQYTFVASRAICPAPPVASVTGWHAPLVQAPPWQPCPHEPQFAPSACRLTHALLQMVSPAVVHEDVQVVPLHVEVPPEGGDRARARRGTCPRARRLRERLPAED